jgi:hypothetical protein
MGGKPAPELDSGGKPGRPTDEHPSGDHNRGKADGLTRTFSVQAPGQIYKQRHVGLQTAKTANCQTPSATLAT